MHNILANSAEKGLNLVLPKYGYRVDGFTDSLKDPAVNEAVEQCLAEIAAESDILKHIESPYVRLAIAWGGALVTSVRSARRKPDKIEKYRYAPPVGSKPINEEVTNKSRPSGGAENREVHSMLAPRGVDVKKV